MSRVSGLERITGVDHDTVKRLEEVNIASVGLLAVQEPKTLHRLTRFDIELCERLITEAQELCPDTRLRTAYEQEQIETNRSYLKFGIKDLDTHLGGGIVTGSLVEVCGPKRLGSYICQHLCFQTLLSKDYGGLENGVVYLSTHPLTELNHLKWRLTNSTIPDAWDRIHLSKVADEDKLFFMLGKAQRLLSTNEYNVLILDSLSDCLFEGREYYRHHSRDELFDEYEHERLMRRDAARILEHLDRIKRGTDAIILYTFEIDVLKQELATTSTVNTYLNCMNDLRFFLYREKDQYRKPIRTTLPYAPEFLLHFIYDRLIESMSYEIYGNPSQESPRDINLRISEEDVYPKEEVDWY